jgi:tetratricopeptide (TPR) repeat protein
LKNLSKQTAAFIRTQRDAAADELAAGQFREALRRYRRVLDIDPADSEARIGLNRGKDLLDEELVRLIDAGKTALEDGRFQDAEATLLKALALDPYNGKAQAVLTRVKSALPPSTTPEDPQKLYLQGIEWYTQGQYREAIAAWTQVPVLSPDHEKALLNIEKARRKLRQIRQHQGK